MPAELIECTKDQLQHFVKTYPRKLERDVFGAYEPPLVTFNDFTLGDWPESVVASYSAPWMPGHPETGHRIAQSQTA